MKITLTIITATLLLRRFEYLPAFLYVFFLFNVFTIVAGSVGVGVVLLPRR